MKSKPDSVPGRREFMRRLGVTAVYGTPAVAVLGAASQKGETPEEIAMHFREAARHLNAAYELGSRYEFTDRDWEMLKPVIVEVKRPIDRFPPRWCEIC